MAALVAICTMAPRALGTDACADETRPQVVVRFEGALWAENLQAEILEHLRAGLSTQKFAICRPSEATRPIAKIALTRDDPDTVAVTIDVRDDVTGKRVVRNVDLREVPPDGRALGVALGADELLRASWVELALADRPEPESPPPPAVEEVVVGSLDAPYRPAEKRHQIGARAAAEHYTGGQTHLGGEIAFRTWLSPALGLELSLGGKNALTEATAGGDIDSFAAGGGLAMLWNMTGPRAVSLQAELGGHLAYVRLQGKASSQARGSDGAALAAYGRAGLALSWNAGSHAGVRARAGLGAPISTVTAQANGRAITGVSGLEIYSGLGAYARF